MTNSDHQQYLAQARDHFAAGRLPDALRAYRKVVAEFPHVAVAHHELGRTCKAMGRRDETFAGFHRAIELDPGFVLAIIDLAIALRETGQQSQAIDRYHKALSLDGGNAVAHCNLGLGLTDLGRFDEAQACFEKAIQLNANYGEAWRGLANNGYFGDDLTRLPEMEDSYGKKTSTDEDRIHLGFGLAKVYEDLHRYDESFACLSVANKLKRDNISFELSNIVTLINGIIETFDQSLFDQHAEAGRLDDTPIFVLGMPRSGSTLVEQILASHPAVFGAGEQPYVEVVISNAINKTGFAFPTGLRDVAGDVFADMADDYLAKLRTHNENSERITDKFLGNFMLIGLIHLMLPKAKIVHVHRDPMDNCFSIYSRLFAKTHLYSYDLGELAALYGLYRSLMDHWQAVLPGRVIDLSYEALIADPETETRALLGHCDLPFHADCLSPHENRRAVLTASNFQVRQPINKASLARYRHFEGHLDVLKTALADYLD